ncbi:ABC transporter substrate-binding protein [Candidatus Dependentiae bacterium]|nr:ABC transporter substrate-binding protein [Candidatus Dependentiae bacterium]
MKRFFTFFFCLFLQCPLWGFDTLSQAVQYARSMPEFPAIENENVLQPTFARFQKEHAQSISSCILEKIFSKRPLWSIRQLCSVIPSLTTSLQGVSSLSIEVTPSEQFLVVGPLHGSFHSLVRILQEYKKKGYLDEELRVVQLHTFLVFDGALFGGSPYGLETLMLIVSVMKKNSKTVFYLNSPANLGQVDLKNEILRRGCSSAGCLEVITEFFKKSPTTLIIKEKKSPSEELVISADSEVMTNKQQTSRSAAFVIPEDRLTSYAVHPGCLLHIPYEGRAVWSVFSAPNLLYRDYFHFYYDAYTLITIAASLPESTIALFNRDIRTPKGFEMGLQASIFTGINLSAKDFSLKKIARESIIALPSTMDLSSAHKYIGLEIEAGLAAALKRANEEGGVQGKIVNLVVKDDYYSPERSRFNIENALKSLGPIIISPVGSEPVAASLDLIKEKKIYILFSNSGSLKLRDPLLTNIINFRASYKSEGKALVTYAYKKLISRRFAFFIQNDGHGLSAFEGAKEALKEVGVKEWTEGYYPHNSIDVETAVAAIKKANPDVIGFFSVAPATVEFIRQIGEAFLVNKKLLALSPLGDKAFRRFLDDHGLSAIFAQVVPNPRTSMLEIAKDYRRDIAPYGLLPDTYSFEGYIYGSLAADFFRKIKGPINPQSLAHVIENLKNYPFKGLTLTYDPSNRQIANNLWLEVSNDTWIEQKNL